ncbi:MAG: shikimate kinase [Victivallaceae bacterium]|nr:shikimate kinase [Victivallaceae bacterium]
MNIILTGMKHCGKSTHGRILAQHLNWAFFDTDTLIEEYYRNAYCCELSCREIYKKVGENIFRKFEANLIKLMLEKSSHSSGNAIIALGGGLIANPTVQPMLKKLGTITFLKVPYEVLYTRIIRKGVPPFLDHDRPYESFIEVCHEREKYYIDNAQLTIDLDNCSMHKASRCVIENIERYNRHINNPAGINQP